MNNKNRVARGRAGRDLGGSSRQRGFSLYELLVTLGVAAGLTVAGTGMFDMVQRHRAVTEVNQFVAHLSLARSEAVRRGETVTFCPSSDGQRCADAGDFSWWQHGTLLFADGNHNDQVDGSESVVRVHAPSEHVQIKSSRFRQRVVYRANGMAGGSTITFTVCAKGAEPRYVIVSNAGRARVSSQPPDGRIDDALERCG